MKEEKKDIVFQCNKCSHLVYLEYDNTIENLLKKLKKMIKMRCPACGEEGRGLWSFIGFGNYELEYPENQ